MSRIAGQLALDLEPQAHGDDFDDLDFAHAQRVLAEEETTAAPRPCVCTRPIVFADALGAGTCGLCGRAPRSAG